MVVSAGQKIKKNCSGGASTGPVGRKKNTNYWLRIF
jgi:hypothetical protein